MQPEFSRPMSVDRIGSVATTQTLDASAEERSALARRFDLQALDRLSATVTLRRARGGQYISISGHVSGTAVQTCVVSLEPVPATVESDFAVILGPIDGAPERGEIDISEEDDALEPWPEEGLDLGELAAQYFSLALDPYPRAPGAEVPDAYQPSEAEPEGYDDTAGAQITPNPFAALAGLAKKS